MSMTGEEFWMNQACKFESWFYQANYARIQQEAENKKLRELVHDLYAFYAWADGATHYGGEPAVFPDDRREVEQRMRELGMLEARESETEA